MRLDALPLTANGKLDRKALPAPDGAAYAARGYEAPASEIEIRLTRIWAEVLGLERVGRHDNFFDLGGHSLAALRLVAQVTSTFDVQVGVASLFVAPTIGEFAARVSKAETPLEPWTIVQIQPLGKKTPIIAINDTMHYYKLAQRIGTDRRFLGVQLFDPSNPCPLPNRNLEEIASDYVRLIRKAQPHGPYILFGLCVSGLIAYETARQLRQVGEPVSLVVLADTWCPGDLERFPLGRRVLSQLYYMLCFRLNYYRHRLNSYRHTLTLLRHGKNKILELRIVRRSKIPNLLSALHLIESPSKPGDEQWMNRWVLQALEYARAIYQPPASAGDVVLLQSEQLPVGRFIDPKMGWSDFVTGQLLLYRIPGWHELMFDDEGAVALIAEHLRPLLNQVDAERNRQR